jgi:hypothetical protein
MSSTYPASTPYIAPADGTRVVASSAMWERLWRTSGASFVVLTIVAVVVRGSTPGVAASPHELTSFYEASHVRIFVATVFLGLAVLNLMWFGAAIKNTLADSGHDGWGTAVVASSAALALLFLLYYTVAAGVALSTLAIGDLRVVSALNSLAWATFVAVAFPRAMFIMATSFGLWRAQLLSNRGFAACVVFVALCLVAGTTWASNGFWAPNGGFSMAVASLMLVWVLLITRVVGRAPAAGTGW